MKFCFKSYFKPTPRKIRKIADALLAAATFSASMTALNGHPVVGTIIFIVGTVAKFLSNFFTDDPPTQTT